METIHEQWQQIAALTKERDDLQRQLRYGGDIIAEQGERIAALEKALSTIGVATNSIIYICDLENDLRLQQERITALESLLERARYFLLDEQSLAGEVDAALASGKEGK